jgi:hypothetical protein
LRLSKNDYRRVPGLTVPLETIFVQLNGSTVLVSFDGGQIIATSLSPEGLTRLGKAPVAFDIEENLPHVLLPLPKGKNGSRFALRSKRGLEIFRVSRDGGINHTGWISGVGSGSVQTGAFGGFDGGGQEDFGFRRSTPITKFQIKAIT